MTIRDGFWRERAEQSAVKHKLLEKYLAAWVKKLGSRHRKLLYVDGFAGQGEYEDGSLGSPLIAVRVAGRVYKKGNFLCIFIEKDGECFENLETKIKSTSVPSHIHIITKKDAFANVAAEILDDVEKKGYNLAPSFWFIDPFGFKGFPLPLVERIMDNRWAEILVTFVARDISRFLKNPSNEKPLNELYGSEVWKEALRLRSPDRDKKLRDLYIKCLKDEGIAHYVNSFQVNMPQQLRTIYYLIHATNHFDGFKIMKDVMYTTGTPGAFAYMGPEEGQLQLFSGQPMGFKDYLSKRFRGKTLTFDQVLQMSYEETDLIEKHYREAIKEMESARPPGVQIRRVTSKRRGLNKDDLITFL